MKRLVRYVFISIISLFCLTCVLTCITQPLMEKTVTEYVFDRSTIASEEVVYKNTKAWKYHVKALNKTTNKYEWITITEEFINEYGMQTTSNVFIKYTGVWMLGFLMCFFGTAIGIVYIVILAFDD